MSDIQAGASSRVCLVVPCYNEAARLDTGQFHGYFAQNSGTHFLFVDDGSTDSTIRTLQGLCQAHEHRASVLTCAQNGGKAEAVRQGILHCLDHLDPTIVGFWDADLATPLDAIDRFLAVLAQAADIEMIFGARIQLLGRQVERRAVRHYLGRIFATAVSNVLRLPIYDTQCGAKLFRVKAETRQVFDQPFLSKWVFDVEIIARYLQLYNHDTKRLSRAIYEYPLEKWTDIAGSKVRPTDFFKAFWDILRIRARYCRDEQ